MIILETYASYLNNYQNFNWQTNYTYYLNTQEKRETNSINKKDAIRLYM